MKKMDGRVTDIKWGCQSSEESLFVPKPFFAKFQCIADLCWKIGHNDWFHAIMRSKCNIKCWTSEIRLCQVRSNGDFSKWMIQLSPASLFPKRLIKNCLLKSHVAPCSQWWGGEYWFLYWPVLCKGMNHGKVSFHRECKSRPDGTNLVFLVLENTKLSLASVVSIDNEAGHKSMN